jgi:hypothetical protein
VNQFPAQLQADLLKPIIFELGVQLVLDASPHLLNECFKTAGKYIPENIPEEFRNRFKTVYDALYQMGIVDEDLNLSQYGVEVIKRVGEELNRF